MPFWISNSAFKELLGPLPLPLLPRTNTTPFPEETEVQGVRAVPETEVEVT